MSLVVGRVSKLYGLDGEMMMNLYDNFPNKIDKEEPLYVKIDTLEVPLFIDSFERSGKRRARVKFADIDNPTRATELIGIEISVKLGGANHKTTTDTQAEAREEGEFMFEELIGYRVELRQELKLSAPIVGEMVDFIDSDLNPLLEIEIEGRLVLVPAVDEFIVSIDTHRRMVELMIPEGLLELYL